ncbi:hypothetical protein [[Ruminococcus] lactaris]|nr:hypothetical protein [[Ruminococcus] lactaris]
MTDREKKELIEAEETILQLFFDAYERAMKYRPHSLGVHHPQAHTIGML